MLARCLREKLRKFKDRALWTGQRGSNDRLTVSAVLLVAQTRPPFSRRSISRPQYTKLEKHRPPNFNFG